MKRNVKRLVASVIMTTLFLPVMAENEGTEDKAKIKESLLEYDDEHPGGFDFSIPLSKHRRGYHEVSLTMSGVGIGFVNSIGGKAPMDISMGRSLEINWTEALGLRYNFNRFNSLEVAFGFLWRNYRMTHQYRFLQDNAAVVTIAPYPDGAVPKFSRLHIFQVTLPLMYSHYLNIAPDWNFCIGPELAINGGHHKHTHTLKTCYSIDGEKFKDKTTDIRINPLSINLVAGIRFRAIGIYARYSPCDVLDTNYGPKFQSFSVGLSLWGF
ncbi:MAG: hypothetical protein J5661_03350 [Bacteroidaceae bacterium]|nr:hypothetical protein [Bacteroidaceae bacterium]